jgi:hypothetical protein
VNKFLVQGTNHDYIEGTKKLGHKKKSRYTWDQYFYSAKQIMTTKEKRKNGVSKTNHYDKGNKMLGRRTNKDYMGNNILVQILTTKEGIHRTNHDYGVNKNLDNETKLRLRGIQFSARKNSRL